MPVQEQTSTQTALMLFMMQKILAEVSDLGDKLDTPTATLTVGETVTGYTERITTGSLGQKKHRKPENYTYLLKVFKEYFGEDRLIAKITAQEIEVFLIEKWPNPNTLAQRLIQLKGIFAWAIRRQKRTKLPTFPNPCDLIEGEKQTIVQPEYIPTENLTPLLKGLTLEHYLLFAIPLSAGLRVEEMLILRPCDITDGRVLTLHWPKSGRRTETAIVPMEIGEKIADYIEEREIRDDQKIFWPSRQGAYNIINRRGKKHGIHLGMHSLRKWCMTFWDRNNDRQMENFISRHASKELRERYVAPLSIEEAVTRQDASLSNLFSRGGALWAYSI